MQLGKYEIISELGKGGFGIVYLAKDLTLDRMVALKVLHPQLAADVEFVRRFQREAKSLAKLEHPNIVPVYEINEVEGRYFIAMRYLPGGSLADRLVSKGALPAEEVLSIARQIISGLSHAHALGLTHCDIKPNNILFDGQGNVLISDFGLARAAQSNNSGTSIMSAAAGTPSYMPPEMWEEQPVTPAVDQYSLACVVCEALTAKKLFDGDTTPRIMTKHFQPLVLPEGIPVGLRDVLAKALSKHPDKRYSDLDAFFAALEVSYGNEHKFGVTPADSEAKKTPEASQDTAEASSNDGTSGPKRPDRVEPVQKIPLKAPGRALLLSIAAFLMIAVSTAVWASYKANPKPPALTQSPTETSQPIASLTDVPTATPIGIPKVTATAVSTETSIVSPTSISTLEPTSNSIAVSTITPSEIQVIKTESDFGETRVREKDGMEQVYVPAGSFMMGSEDGDSDERPVHKVFLDAYWIDKYEVTTAQYKKCVDSGSCSKPFFVRSTTRGIYYGNTEFADYPVISVNWYSASDYCIWVEGRLPTEAEWEKAARGDEDQRIYPWGEVINDKKANYFGIVNDTNKVGSYSEGASPYGAMDMAGNVWEWVADSYLDVYYDSQANASNPTGSTTWSRVLRGGSWLTSPDNLRVSNRYQAAEYFTGVGIGFRCVGGNPLLSGNQTVTIEQTSTPIENPAETPTSTTTSTSEENSTRIREKDGMEQVYVPAGNFKMGSQVGLDDEKPIHEVYLDGYWIDKYEVSNAQYEKCVKEANFCFSFGAKSSTQERYYGNPIYSDYPKIFISWDSAKSYCEWVGGRLPTEAEWEKAARGDTDQRTYPWGEGIDNQKANYGGNVGDTTRVGSYPAGASPYGVMDMAGNVWEWVSDLYEYNYYDMQTEWDNPTGPPTGYYHILRGGSWNYGQDYQRVTVRYNMYRYLAVNHTGFRCVSSP